MATKDLEPVQQGAVTAEDIELAYAAIRGEAEIARVEDPEVMSQQILARIQKAESFDEVFAEQTVPAWRDLLGVPVIVHSFHLNRSGFEGGSNVYAIVDIERLDDGEHLTVSHGGRNVLAQLVKALEKGWLGQPEFAVKLSSKTTADSNTVFWLVAASTETE